MHIEIYACYDEGSAITMIFILPIMHARLPAGMYRWTCILRVMRADMYRWICILRVMHAGMYPWICILRVMHVRTPCTICILRVMHAITYRSICIFRVMHAMMRGPHDDNHFVIWQRRLEKWNSYVASLCAKGCKLRRPTSTSVVGNILTFE